MAYINNSFKRNIEKPHKGSYQPEETEELNIEGLTGTGNRKLEVSRDLIQYLQTEFGYEINDVLHSGGIRQFSPYTVTSIMEAMAEHSRRQFNIYIDHLQEKHVNKSNVKDFINRSSKLFCGMDMLLKELGISEFQWEESFNFSINYGQFINNPNWLDTLLAVSLPMEKFSVPQRMEITNLFKQKLDKYCKDIADRYNAIPDEISLL